MRIQYALYARSTSETNSNSGGLGTKTIIFIVLGVVCLLVILIGFYLVSRPRAACHPAPNVASSHLQHSPIISPPRAQCTHDRSEYWKIWRIWRHTSSMAVSPTADSPTSQLSPPSITITTPTRIHHARGPSIVSRPSQSRRITSLSVATSFSHSHITEEALSDFRASAYDLDGDLETEMLHSARDDVWPGLPLAVEDGYGGVMEEGMESRGNVTAIVEGSAEGNVPTHPATQPKGSDFENVDTCQRVASSDVEGGVRVVDEEAMGQELR